MNNCQFQRKSGKDPRPRANKLERLDTLQLDTTNGRKNICKLQTFPKAKHPGTMVPI